MLYCRIGRVVQCEELHVKWPTVDRDALANSESIDEQFDSLVEVNDILLEKTVQEFKRLLFNSL